MEFKKVVQEAKFRSPLEGFQEVTQAVEVRTDPLTGRRCRINIERAKRPKQVQEKTAGLEDLIARSKEKCFFCPGMLESSTPKLPRGMPDRIKAGKAVVFPNLFPFGGYHAVGVFSDDHYLRLDEFTPELLRDCLVACIRYFETISSENPEIRYWYINWNCLPPGAASIVHPHVQVFADSNPTSFLKELMGKSRDYHADESKNYWADLIEAEKAGNERYIGKSGAVHWLASFAPQGNKEVMAVVEEISSPNHLEKKLGDFCEGLSKVLKGYHDLGVRSMTFSTYSGPTDELMDDFYWLNARLIARPHPDPFYVTDCGFMEKLQLEPVIETMPEGLAEKLKKHFQRKG